jgi:large subunit ribosomal protein L24
MKIRRGDMVQVLSGKDRGKQGKVLRGLPAEEKVVVEGVRVVKKHQKPTGAARRGGIIELTLPVPAAKVQLVCPSCSRPTRVGYKVTDDKKERVCKKCGEVVKHG